MNSVSRAKIAIILSRLETFDKPKNRLEQYSTDSEVASVLLWNAKQDIVGRTVADLGAGTGILGIGALLLGAKHVDFVDIDESIKELLQRNIMQISQYKIGTYKFYFQDIGSYIRKTETVVMNPPFGTRIKHADKNFLSTAFKIADKVYSIHKSSTIRFLEKFSADNGFEIDQLDRLRFPLKSSYSFHKSKMKYIETVITRFSGDSE